MLTTLVSFVTLLVGCVALVYILRLRTFAKQGLPWLLLAGSLIVAVAWHAGRLASYLIEPQNYPLELPTEIAALGMFLLALAAIVTATPLFRKASEAQEALHETEQRYKHIFENAHIGIYRTTPDGRILVANPALVKMMGYSSLEELQKRNLEQEGFGPGYSRALFKDLVERPGGVRGLESQWVRKDGSIIHIRENAIAVRDRDGKVLYYEGTVEDITERVLAERKLKEQEKQYRRLVELAPFGIAVHRNGRGLYANPAAAQIVGFKAEDFPGADIFQFVHPDDREAARTRIERVMSQSEVVGSFPVRYVKPSGEIVFAQAINAPIEFEGELAVMTVFQDVTESRKAQELERQLARAARMEALGRLAGGIAHDFNNLLTAIMGYTALLKEHIEGARAQGADKECAELALSWIDEISKATSRGASLTRQLLAFSRKQIAEFKFLNLNDVVQDIESLLRRVIGEGITLRVELSPNLWSVRADEGQLEQVILNLVLNARDAMNGGGTITIATKNTNLQEPLPSTTGDVIPPGPFVVLSVEDTGSGIDQSLLPHIFEPFFTTKDATKGTGLGLSTVYGIVRQSGGRIVVSSHLGEGTRFDIYLPGYLEPAAPLKRAEATQTCAQGKETVLLVEDEESVRNLARAALEGLGYTVLAAPDGEEATRLVAERGLPLDLLITDVVMPKMSGPDLAKELRKRQPDLKVLFISGYPEKGFTDEGELANNMAFLGKPFTANDLALKVRELLDRSSGLNSRKGGQD